MLLSRTDALRYRDYVTHSMYPRVRNGNPAMQPADAGTTHFAETA